MESEISGIVQILWTAKWHVQYYSTGNTTRATAASFRQLLEPPNKLTAKVTLYRRLIYSNYQLLFLFYYIYVHQTANSIQVRVALIRPNLRYVDCGNKLIIKWEQKAMEENDGGVIEFLQFLHRDKSQ